MDNEKLYKSIFDAVIDLDEEKVGEFTQQIIDEKIDVLEAIEKAYSPAIRKLGELFDEGEYFLPELMIGGEMVKESIDTLLPHLPSGVKRESKGKVVMATIEGDNHTIGKTIVSTMLSAYGYEVKDLGANVSPAKIIDTAVDEEVDIIGVSALLTTTMPGQKKVIDMLRERGLRNNFKVIIGGAPVNEFWVKKSGADGYAPSGSEAVRLVQQLLDA